MKSKKCLGIWMDHSMAHLIELNSLEKDIKSIEAKSNLPEIDSDPNNDESNIQNKEQNSLAEYFKKLSEVIRDFDDVILFGPTDAKMELLNILKKDHRFDKIKIESRPSDKMSENQMAVFVKDYFLNEEKYVNL